LLTTTEERTVAERDNTLIIYQSQGITQINELVRGTECLRRGTGCLHSGEKERVAFLLALIACRVAVVVYNAGWREYELRGKCTLIVHDAVGIEPRLGLLADICS
jgi:hypothetical protein